MCIGTADLSTCSWTCTLPMSCLSRIPPACLWSPCMCIRPPLCWCYPSQCLCAQASLPIILLYWLLWPFFLHICAPIALYCPVFVCLCCCLMFLLIAIYACIYTYPLNVLLLLQLCFTLSLAISSICVHQLLLYCLVFVLPIWSLMFLFYFNLFMCIYSPLKCSLATPTFCLAFGHRHNKLLCCFAFNSAWK